MRRTLLLPILLLLSFTAFAQSGEWGSRGISRHFAILGDLVFAADGRGVTTYDVSNATNIIATDFDTTGEETYDVAIVAGSPAHVAVATKRGIDWYRVEGSTLTGPVERTESTEPITHIAAGTQLVAAATTRKVTLYRLQSEDAISVAQYDFRNDVLAVALVNDVLYASVDREGTYVYQQPSVDWSTKLLEVPLAFARSGNTLWGVSRDTGLTGYNVQNPASPIVISSTGSGTYLLDGVAATSSRVFAFEKNNQLRVFDVTDPAKPSLVTTLEEWTNAIAANGNRVFFAGAIIDSEKMAFETGHPLRVLDATTLSTTGEFTALAGPVSGVWTNGSLAYVIDPPYLRILDVSKTAEPREISSIVVPNIQDHITVKNGLAVIYGRKDVLLYDVKDPLAPRFMSSWFTQGHAPSWAAITANKVVEANGHSGFHVVDYMNYPAPVQVSGRKWDYHGLTASDDVAYLILHGVLIVVEIANGKDAVDHAKFSLLGEQVEIMPPNSAYPSHLIFREPEGIRVFSLANRFEPQSVAYLPIRAGLMATGDGVAYFDIDGTLQRLDVANPSGLTATEMKVVSPMQISVAGEKVVVADRYSLRVYGPDTASPLPPARGKRRAVN